MSFPTFFAPTEAEMVAEMDCRPLLSISSQEMEIARLKSELAKHIVTECLRELCGETPIVVASSTLPVGASGKMAMENQSSSTQSSETLSNSQCLFIQLLFRYAL